ncbi:EcoKI restriction-modification system protein HsdS [Moraxella lacunata]|uniref:EcoKI restriction-modification system protein HsdS n=1 Tax=Moraxella lacunata TaxID=477 RepID=A0A378TQU1_MORLA|nr:restriction endonuclease subunit S [Moraxella lacunata]STZ63229.1 EcoKI restriction-modification system protein HsdS [Moraxella lacunata]
MSILNLSECKKVIDFRIDANTYKKDYLKTDKLITMNKYYTIGDMSLSVQNFGAYSLCSFINFQDNGIPFLMTENVRENYIDWNIQKFVDLDSHKMLYKSHCKKDQVLVTMAGEYLGRVAVYNKDFICSSNQAIAKITLKKNFNPYLISTFLNTKYGQNQINRLKTITGQPNINMSLIKDLKVLNFDEEFSEKIEMIVKKSLSNKELSQQIYQEAEALLLENLGLQNFQPTNQSVNIKALKDSFLQTGRLDAEFYQPIYEQLENHIFSHSTGFEKLGDVCHLNDENYTPKDNQEYDYIELSNIGKSGEITGSTRAFGKELPSRARRKVRTNQVMISSIEGSLQSCAIVPVHYDNALCSTGFYVLSSDKINAETLLVLFKSSLMQQILKKNCSGTILTAINKEELLNIPLPIIDEKIQTQIAEFVRQSNELREQATQLLAQAKYSVEAEIEQSALQERERERERLINEANYHLRLAEWVLLESLLLGQPKNISVQSFSQSFGISGRLDAEYHQPKYKRLLQKLKQHHHKTLGELVDLQKSVEVGSENYRDEGLPFVRVADFSKFGISQTDKFVSPADFADIIRPKKDTILLSKDGTVGIAYCVPSDLEVITSGAIVHLSLKTDEILPDYLALVLNSEAVQLQAERDAGGSIIQHWKPSEILEVVIPILPKDIQQAVSDKVQMSFELKKQSENLLEQAKVLVENEIKNGVHATP